MREGIRQHGPRLLILIGIGSLVALIGAIEAGYLFGWEWTGVSASTEVTDAIRDNETTRTVKQVGAKTLWDWMGLLIVPLVLAIGGYIYNRTEKQRDQATTVDNQREAALQAYLDKMSELLLRENLRKSNENTEASHVARARTLTVLSRLDQKRKASIIQFLYESQLINTEKPIINLFGANFSKIQLQSTDLEDINLSGAILHGANLLGARLHRANLSRAHLSWSNLSITHLARANLSGAYLSGADLSRANLSGANLSEANLSEANLREAMLLEAMLLRANLRKANLSNAHLKSTQLPEANLSGADLSRANLSGANLSEANLSGSNLSEANLSEANLCRANLSGADLARANLSGADLSRANIEGANIAPQQLKAARGHPLGHPLPPTSPQRPAP